MLNKLLGIVQNSSEHGFAVDSMLEMCHWFMLALFIGWSGFFLLAVTRYRKSKHPKASYHGVTSHYSTHAEATVVFIEAVLLIGLAFPIWAKRVLDLPPEGSDVMRIRAIAEQYAWNFHYPGKDGVFGDQSSAFVTASNPLGLDPASEASKDDFVSKNEIHIINQRPVVVEVSSKDVIHGFAIPHMRVSQDAIPGTKVPLWFRPIREGKFEIVCAQLCGGGHYAMRSHLIVESAEKFNAFAKELSDMQHPAGK